MIRGGGTPPPYKFPTDLTKIARAEDPAGRHWDFEAGIRPEDAPLGSHSSLKQAIRAASSISQGYAGDPDLNSNYNNAVAVMEAGNGQFELHRTKFFEDLNGTGDEFDFEQVGRSKVEGPFFNRRYTGWADHTFERVGEAGQALRAFVDGPVVVHLP